MERREQPTSRFLLNKIKKICAISCSVVFQSELWISYRSIHVNTDLIHSIINNTMHLDFGYCIINASCI